MKVTIEPETDDERAASQKRTFVGLQSLAVIGIAYEGELLRIPCSHTHGNLHDIMRELPILQYYMTQRQLADDNARS